MDKDGFTRVWHAVGAHGDEAYAELARRWREPHRHYHDTEHLEECLAWLDALGGAERPEELALALYFHDAVYDPTRTDNEAESASLLARLGRDAGVRDEVIARVSALVLSTAKHASSSGDTALLSDIDLAILGAPPARYTRYAHDVRREYAHLDDATYRAGRRQVLTRFLERLSIYQTPSFQRLEPQARHNLARELARHEGEAEEG
jgi:predicted metal-dependent HD superfamily phosphohydrolase